MSDSKEERGFTLADTPDVAPGTLPSIDLSTFVLSLGASAMLHLGLAPGPAAAKAVAGERPTPEKNLPGERPAPEKNLPEERPAPEKNLPGEQNIHDYTGSDLHKMFATMLAESNQLVDDAEAYEQRMNRPVNRIGSTAREMQRGDINSALLRGLASGDERAELMVRMGTLTRE